MKDHYKTLNVHPDAEPVVIQFAYKALSRTYHPDVYRHPDAEEKMKAINEAYEILNNPHTRARYAAEFAESTAAPPPHPQRSTEHTPPPRSASSDSVNTVKRFAELLASRAQYGFRGEKPLALMAVLTAMRSLNITGQGACDVLNSRMDTVKTHFITLAQERGTMKDIHASWSVITSGKNSEMNRAIQGSPGADSACASLTKDEIDELIRWFEGNS